jgi:polyferredoxin
MLLKYARRVVQVAFVMLAMSAGIRLALGWSLSSVETFCPFGGLETLYSVLTQQQFSCAMGELNLALFLALLLLTLVARKAFCSWVCPVGTVSEGMGALGERLRRRLGWSKERAEPGLISPPRRVDRGLRWLRLPILVLVLLTTFHAGELIFRPLDPYYVMFSAHGHDVEPWSYGILAAILAGTFLVSMTWCRYLCPLGGVLWPFSRIGVLRIVRDETGCQGCGSCDRACPHGLQISGVAAVSSGECTLCLECTHACSTPGTLSVRASGRASWRTPRWAVPALVVALAVLGVGGSRLLALPSYEREYAAAGTPPSELSSVDLVIRGIRCVSTAQTAAAQLDGVPGLARFTAYAARHEAHLAFDPRRTDLEQLRRALEAPVYHEKSQEYVFHRFKVLEVRWP